MRMPLRRGSQRPAPLKSECRKVRGFSVLRTIFFQFGNNDIVTIFQRSDRAWATIDDANDLPRSQRPPQLHSHYYPRWGLVCDTDSIAYNSNICIIIDRNVQGWLFHLLLHDQPQLPPRPSKSEMYSQGGYSCDSCKAKLTPRNDLECLDLPPKRWFGRQRLLEHPTRRLEARTESELSNGWPSIYFPWTQCRWSP